MRRIAVVALVIATVASANARPSPRRPGFAHHRTPPRIHHHHHHHHSRGAAVAAGIVGGAIIGSALVDALRPDPPVVTTVVQPSTVVVQPSPVVVQQPVVVQPPVVVQQPVVVQPATRVWVEGRYVDQVQANGTIIRTWVPGHYEMR